LTIPTSNRLKLSQNHCGCLQVIQITPRSYGVMPSNSELDITIYGKQITYQTKIHILCVHFTYKLHCTTTAHFMNKKTT